MCGSNGWTVELRWSVEGPAGSHHTRRALCCRDPPPAAARKRGFPGGSIPSIDRHYGEGAVAFGLCSSRLRGGRQAR